MSRLNVVTPELASDEQSELFGAIRAKLGGVPNFLKVIANSPAALRAFLGLHVIAGDGTLDPQTRERIALALAEQTGCQYCVSAHTAIGRKAGLDSAEIDANRSGTSHNARAAAAVKFARSIAENHGDVSNGELLGLRNAGFDDAQIVEIITHTAMNLLTNFVGKISRVDIDFPKIELRQAS